MNRLILGVRELRALCLRKGRLFKDQELIDAGSSVSKQFHGRTSPESTRITPGIVRGVKKDVRCGLSNRKIANKWNINGGRITEIMDGKYD